MGIALFWKCKRSTQYKKQKAKNKHKKGIIFLFMMIFISPLSASPYPQGHGRGANDIVISPTVSTTVGEHLNENRLYHINRYFHPKHKKECSNIALFF
ncbi:MAG: hypothetical protein E7569_16540 [Ruminococcaceae bacterium]|nr:hypothetical protein [Oscillospiraceae bacterium]